MSMSASAGCAAAATITSPSPSPSASCWRARTAGVEALGRRSVEQGAERPLQVGDLRMGLLSRRVTRGARAITLQPREFKLLEYLMRHADQVVTRTMLLEAVWDYNFDPQTNVVDVHISKLRAKLEHDSEQPLVRTVRNAGYMMSAHE